MQSIIKKDVNFGLEFNRAAKLKNYREVKKYIRTNVQACRFALAMACVDKFRKENGLSFESIPTGKKKSDEISGHGINFSSIDNHNVFRQLVKIDEVGNLTRGGIDILLKRFDNDKELIDIYEEYLEKSNELDKKINR